MKIASEFEGTEQERAQAVLDRFEAEKSELGKEYLTRLTDWLLSGQNIVTFRKSRKSYPERAKLNRHFATLTAVELIRLSGREVR